MQTSVPLLTVTASPGQKPANIEKVYPNQIDGAADVPFATVFGNAVRPIDEGYLTGLPIDAAGAGLPPGSVESGEELPLSFAARDHQSPIPGRTPPLLNAANRFIDHAHHQLTGDARPREVAASLDGELPRDADGQGRIGVGGEATSLPRFELQRTISEFNPVAGSSVLDVPPNSAEMEFSKGITDPMLHSDQMNRGVGATEITPRQEAPKSFTLALDVTTPASVREWQEGFAQRFTMMVREGTQQARILLDPPHLGPLDLRISVVGNEASVNFTTHHAATRDIIEDALPLLKDMLDSQGLSLGDANVDHRNAHAETDELVETKTDLKTEEESDAPAVESYVATVNPTGRLDIYA